MVLSGVKNRFYAFWHIFKLNWVSFSSFLAHILWKKITIPLPTHPLVSKILFFNLAYPCVPNLPTFDPFSVSWHNLLDLVRSLALKGHLLSFAQDCTTRKYELKMSFFKSCLETTCLQMGAFQTGKAVVSGYNLV